MSGPFNGSKTPEEQSAIAAHTDALFYRDDDPDKTYPNPPKNKNRKPTASKKYFFFKMHV
jgi:hypothetical protein